MSYDAGKYDVAVIGAGHAGIEAALASARLGCRTVIFTINMDAVGNCPCNPSIGGTAKGHLVREVDALGGEMGKTADECTLQSRMLNLGKGPAVHSLRAQIDRNKYARVMKHKLEQCENLVMRQAEVIDIERDGENWLLTTRLGAVYTCRAVVLATGTFLGGRIFVGEVSYAGGPDGMFPATELAGSLKSLAFRCAALKPVLRRACCAHPSILPTSRFKRAMNLSRRSHLIRKCRRKTRLCAYVSWTNDRTKQVILDNIHRSPLYAGMIEGVGPRYCPSIEDKIMRFSEKPRHQLFIEPCGAETEEMYLQGMSSSLPEEVQIAFYRTIKGLEHVEIMRNAYAIEYDCCDPLQLNATLEFRDYPGLYGAGQFNGSSGYEEAAAQGLVAGANAALKVLNRDPLILDRAGSYIGTLIDDLITKGVTDPYRMMTSRSEYRLVLRQDNADERLTPIGRELGLIDDRRWAKFEKKQAQKEAEMKRAEKTVFSPTDALNEVLVSCETSPVATGVRLSELLRRPQVTYADLTPIDIERPNYPREIFESVETALKYEGYIKRQLQDIAEMRRLEKKLLPKEINYAEISGLRLEAQEKLNRVRPENVGQAGRISGVSPADISVLLIWLSAHNEGK